MRRLVGVMAGLLVVLGGCATPVPPPPVAEARPDAEAAYHQCAAQSAAATAGLTARKGEVAGRLFRQCMAAKAPNDPAAAP